jgi:hypothetical protein
MEDPSSHPDADRELNDLRARAYGPDADIHTDPAARKRLIELEAAHVSHPATVPRVDSVLPPAAGVRRPAAAANVVAVSTGPAPADAPQSSTHSTMTSHHDARSFLLDPTWIRHLALVTAASLAAATVFFSLTWLLGPHPDATQRPIPVETEFAPVDPLINHGANPDISNP